MNIDLNHTNTRKRIAAFLEFLDGLNEENFISATDTANFLRNTRSIEGDVEDEIVVQWQRYEDDADTRVQQRDYDGAIS